MADMQALGETLYGIVQQIHPELAGKLVGMLLQLGADECVLCVNDMERLAMHLDEAMALLDGGPDQHRTQKPEPAPKKAASKSTSATVAEDIIPGLTMWLDELKLGKFFESVTSWIENTGACSLEEVVDSMDEFADALNLKPLERNRLQKNGSTAAKRAMNAASAAKAAEVGDHAASAQTSSVSKQKGQGRGQGKGGGKFEPASRKQREEEQRQRLADQRERENKESERRLKAETAAHEAELAKLEEDNRRELGDFEREQEKWFREEEDFKRQLEELDEERSETKQPQTETGPAKKVGPTIRVTPKPAAVNVAKQKEEAQRRKQDREREKALELAEQERVAKEKQEAKARAAEERHERKVAELAAKVAMVSPGTPSDFPQPPAEDEGWEVSENRKNKGKKRR